MTGRRRDRAGIAVPEYASLRLRRHCCPLEDSKSGSFPRDFPAW